MANEVPTGYVTHFFGGCHGGDLLEHFNECGARWKRGGSGWQTQEPQPGEYDFADWDDLTERAEATGVELLPVLNYTAPWAAEDPDAEASHSPIAEDAVDAWREYVGRFADRYPDLEYFEVWNEPNIRKFLDVGEGRQHHEVYVDRILEPAAEALHDRDRTVVAPAVTTEAWGWNARNCIERIDEWLGYGDALDCVDVLSVHYTKGDTPKLEVEGAGDLQPLYDHVYEEYVARGDLEGIWNTEEGFTAVEAGDAGFVALEPWERKPYPQWVPRYTVPHIHWALDHGWEHRDDYKLFWYRVGTETAQGTLDACNLVEERDGEVVPSDRGRALRTLRDVLTDGATVGVYPEEVRVGFGLYPVGTEAFHFSPHEFTSYAFTLDEDLLVVAWLDLPGIELTDRGVAPIQLTVDGVDGDPDVETIDYLSGETTAVEGYERVEGELRVDVPRTADPVLYVRLRR